MGSACCVARKDSTLRSGTSGESLRRNVIYSPSWSYRWDNRRRVAGEIENSSYEPSHGISTNSSMEIKGDLALERGVFSARGSPLGTFGSPVSQMTPMHEGIDSTLAGNDNMKSSIGSPATTMDSPAPKSSLSVPSTSPLFSPIADPLCFQTPLLPPKSSHSRRVHQSPGRHLLRHVSDSRIMGLRSPNSSGLVSEGRPSFVLSVCSNDTAVGSQAGSSDGWSMRTFSELVASSQRERWSFDSEFLGSGHGKLSEESNNSTTTLSCSPPSLFNLRTCGICSKLLTERSSWKCTEVAAVAVLVCGHVYHSECLESVTNEGGDQYDPPCPTCTFGEKELSKVARKLSRAEAEMKSRSYKACRSRVVENYQEGRVDDVLDRRKTGEKMGNSDNKMEASSSTRRSSFGKPFLRRHFSLGSKWSRSLSDTSSSSSSGRKGFWARYR